VVIPTHNRAKILTHTLKSLYAVNVPDEGLRSIEVLVIANACTDDTKETVSNLAEGARFMTRCIEEPRIGLNIARNRGVEEARHEVIALLDDDVDVKPDWLLGLVETYRECNPDLVSGRITLWWDAVSRPPWLDESMEGILSKLDLGLTTHPITSFVHAVGANFSFKKSVYDKVGPFAVGLDRVGDQTLSCGETEFVRRVFDGGFTSYYCGKMHVGHWVAPNRPKKEYMTRIIDGFGASMILLRRKFGVLDVTAQLIYRSSLVIWYFLRMCITKTESTQGMKFRLNVHYNIGALKGVLIRLRGRSPL